MTPEAKVKKKLKEIFKARGVYYHMPRGTAFGKAGVPDFKCAFHGWGFGVEAKTLSNKPTALQRYQHEQALLGGEVTLIINEHNQEALTNALDFMERNSRLEQAQTLQKHIELSGGYDV